MEILSFRKCPSGIKILRRIWRLDRLKNENWNGYGIYGIYGIDGIARGRMAFPHRRFKLNSDVGKMCKILLPVLRNHIFGLCGICPKNRRSAYSKTCAEILSPFGVHEFKMRDE
jgi:hypothetical protein